MSLGRVFETIEGVEYEIDVKCLLMNEVEVARNNTLKHGLTAKLEPQSVLQWYRVIVNVPKAQLPLFQNLSHLEGLALTLAQAEVCLKRVLIKIAEFNEKRDPLFEERENLDEELFRLQRTIRNTDLPKNTRGAARIIMKISNAEFRQLEHKIARRARFLLRYKSEAESKQRKAQKVWCNQFKKD
jgi:hypothetical protein